MTLKTVLFDLDDTLFDHFETSRASLAEICLADPVFNRPPFAEFEGEFHRLLNEIHARVIRGYLSKDEARLERWRQLYVWCGAEAHEKEVVATSKRYRERYLELRKIVPGAVELVSRLKSQFMVGVVTNNMTAGQAGKLVFCGLDSLIDFMVTSEEVGSPKPEPAIFNEALQRSRSLPDETVMVGDSWPVDILGARGVGMRAVWLNRHGQPCPDPAQAAEIPSFADVEKAYNVITDA